jgi:murein DD-endopeptidase MepM/ murein hydrolase activator NlpD
MWAPIRGAGVLAVVALAFAQSAGARTDGPRQLLFGWPTAGTVTSPFGWDGARPHSGIDIGILRALEVRAGAPGVVTAVGWRRGYEGYGLLVLVNVGRPYVALYAHLAATRVHVGQLVDADDVIGVAGCTGWCTGTHLHFEVRRAGIAVDPLPLLPA